MRKKQLIALVSFIVIIIVVIIAYQAYNAKNFYRYCESQTGFSSLKEGKALTCSFSFKFKYIFVKLEADADPVGKTVKYFVINPEGTVIDKGEFDKSSHLSLNKKYKWIKGNWQIKFESSDLSETISCNYILAGANTEQAVLNQCGTIAK